MEEDDGGCSLGESVRGNLKSFEAFATLNDTTNELLHLT